MRGRAIATALAVAAMAAAVAGCSGSGDGPVATAPEPAPTGTGYFVGGGADGVGASLDLHGSDPVSVAIDDALIGRDGTPGSVPAVGIASVVNEGAESVPGPHFVAVLADGHGAIPIPAAEDVLRPGDGPAARRALRLLARLPARVPAEGAATYYVILDEVAPAEVGSVRMVVTPGSPITLQARRR